jgi:ribosomal protein S3AE
MVEKLKFVKVEIPTIGMVVDVLAKDLKEMDNKTVTIDLTRQLKGRGLDAVFQIHVQNDKLVAEPVRLTIFGFYIRRMMRKGIDYVEDSFDFDAKDARMTIKLFLITRKKIHRALKHALVLKAREELVIYMKDTLAAKVFEDILAGDLQRHLSQKLKKIYPLTFCDVRDIFVVKKK